MFGNLHDIAVGVIGAVNPQIPCFVRYSTGVATYQPDGKAIPGYSAPQRMQAQVQSLTFQDIEHLDSMNIQGARRSFYLYGQESNIVRFSQQGGDLIDFPTAIPGYPAGTVWLIALVPDSYPGWCHVLATLQNEASVLKL